MHLWDEFENTLISFWSYRVRKIFRKFELWPQPEIWTCPRPTTVKFNPGISLALVSCFSALNSVNSTGVQVGSIWIYSLWSRSVYRKKKTPPVGQKCFVRVHRHVWLIRIYIESNHNNRSLEWFAEWESAPESLRPRNDFQYLPKNDCWYLNS